MKILNKHLSLIVLLLLISLKSWSWNESFTGSNTLSDTTVVVSIDLIKKANVKMIERKYFIKLNEQKDSIITLKDKYINEQQNIINDFKNKLVNANELNKSIKKELDKKTKYNNILLGSSCSIIVCLITYIIIK